MDVCEKRVLRRRAGVIAEGLRLTEGVTVQGYRQGLLDYQGLVSVLEYRRNRDRVLQFLELIEDVRPAAFEKLCYFLENHGNSRLADELIVELICEKGHFRLDPDVLDEVRELVRDRLGDKANLDTQDLEELTVMIATRYQKEAFLRQDRKAAKLKSMSAEGTGVRSEGRMGSGGGRKGSAGISDQVDELCNEVEQCMSGLMASRSSSQPGKVMGTQGKVSDSQAKVMGTQGKVTDSHGQAKDQHGSSLKYNYTDASSSWINELKRKLTNLNNAQVSPELFSVRDRQHGSSSESSSVSRASGHDLVDTQHGEGQTNKPIKVNGHKRAHASDGQTKAQQAGTNTNSGACQTWLAPSGAQPSGVVKDAYTMEDFAETIKEMDEPKRRSKLPKVTKGKSKVSKARIQQLLNPTVKVERKPIKAQEAGKEGSLENRQGEEGIETVQGGRSNGKGKSQTSKDKEEKSQVKGKSERNDTTKATKRGAKGKEEPLEWDLPEYHILTEAEEAALQQDVHNLHRAKHHISNVRRAVSGVANQRMARGLTQLEDMYWRRRCDVMKRCQATGYYYFLSSHKRHRCDACLHSGPTPYDQCAWFEPGEEPPANYLGSPNLQRPELNLYSASSFTDMRTLDKFTETASSESKSKAVRFDDCDCPGAVAVAGQKNRRCLACAYANEEVSLFYDAAVTTEGSYHFAFPSLHKYYPTKMSRTKTTFMPGVVAS